MTTTVTEIDKPKYLKDLLNVSNLIEVVQASFNKVGFEYIAPLSEGELLENISKAINKEVSGV